MTPAAPFPGALARPAAPVRSARPLVDLTRPLFACVARLHREARRGVALDHLAVRREIEGLLSTMRDRSAADAPLAAQYTRVEAALVFFVDYMVKEGPFPFASQWQELAFSIGEGAGDEKFFDLLDACLADPGAEAVERLWVFYECLGLGFDGMFARERKQLQRRVKILALRLGLDPQRDGFPVDGAPLPAARPFRHPALRLRTVVGALLLLVVALAAANVIAYNQTTRDLRGTLERFTERTAGDLAPAGAVAPPNAPAEGGR